MKHAPMKRQSRRGGAMPHKVYETVMLRNKGLCEAGLPGCGKHAVDFHHRQRRQPGNDTVENGAALCRACHSFITFTSPRKGKELGLIVHSHHPDPGKVPMCVRGEWFILLPDGSYKRTEQRP